MSSTCLGTANRMRDYGKTAWIVVVGFVLALGARAAVAQSIGTERLVSGLAFPTYLTAPPGDLDRIFVTERFGDIEIIDVATGVRNPLPFLTVPGVAGEGLQGLAFHPDYDVNGFFYVYYYGSAQSQVVRFTVSGDPDRATVGSAFTIIKISQPAAGHNGGWIGFGPDQYLYVPLGDGGIQHDPDDHSQTIEDDLLGAVTIFRVTPIEITPSPRPIRSSGWPATTRSGPTASATRFARASIARPVTCTSPTWARPLGKR
jgi:hypothetical protein